MKKSTLMVLLMALAPFFSTNAAIAVSSVHSQTQIQHQHSGAVSTKTTSKTGLKKLFQKKDKQSRVSKLKEKLQKKLAKLKAKPVRGASQYLTLCLLLVVVSILFFAFNKYSVIFNAFGSIAAIAAAVFFVLWLLEYTGTL